MLVAGVGRRRLGSYPADLDALLVRINRRGPQLARAANPPNVRTRLRADSSRYSSVRTRTDSPVGQPRRRLLSCAAVKGYVLLAAGFVGLVILANWLASRYVVSVGFGRV